MRVEVCSGVVVGKICIRIKMNALVLGATHIRSTISSESNPNEPPHVVTSVLREHFGIQRVDDQPDRMRGISYDIVCPCEISSINAVQHQTQ